MWSSGLWDSWTVTRTTVLGCAIVAAAACEDEPAGPPPIVPATIEVSPDSALLDLPDGTVQLTAVVRDQNGEEVEDAAIGWSSADTTVATVDANGLVTARDEGSTEVTARHDTIMASARSSCRTVPAESK